jgi:hypothetical protein
VLRLLAAGAGATALVFDYDYVLGFSTFSTENYFSYFTFQSNLLNVIVLGSSGALLLKGHVVGRTLSSARALVTCYVIVSGIVFALIVSQAGSHNYRIDVPWTSQLLHFYMPAYLIVDWLIGVGRVRLRWRIVGIVLIFPVVWGVFTLIRGSIVRWYPYFFLDPDQVSGPAEFALYCGIAIGLFAAITAGLVAVTRLPPVWGRNPRGSGQASGSTAALRRRTGPTSRGPR